MIPARGGSKGISRKNIRLLGGKPLIAHSIEAARRSTSVTTLYVSTEDAEIAAIARDFGAETLMRPAEIARDETPMAAVVKHVLEHVVTGYDIFLLLQPTSPLRTPRDIDDSLAYFSEPSVQSVISVVNVEDHHPYRMYRIEEGRLAALNPKFLVGNRQDLPPVFQRNGAIYACRIGLFEKTGCLWDESPAAYVMPRDRSVNIDEPLDFDFAEFLVSRKAERSGTR
jgi:CMP-N-acetylneuraminic acid synthetase